MADFVFITNVLSRGPQQGPLHHRVLLSGRRGGACLKFFELFFMNSRCGGLSTCHCPGGGEETESGPWDGIWYTTRACSLISLHFALIN